MKQFAVIGLGRFGSSVARKLSEKGHQVLAIDKDGEKVQDASSYVAQSVELDAGDEKGLRAIGIESVDCVIVSIGGVNLQASILITVILKDIGIKEIIAKAANELHAKVLRKVGATKVIFPEQEMGIRLANSLVSPRILEQIELSQDYSIIETLPPKEFIGKSLRKLEIRAKHGITVIAIKEKKALGSRKEDGEISKVINILPEADYVIKEDEVLVVIGGNKDIEKLKKKV